MNAPVQCMTARDAGHVFRSKLIDVFARFEIWTVKILRAEPLDSSGKKSKVPLLLGKRIDKVNALTISHLSLFRSAHETAALLKRLEPYNALRTTLVHGEMVVSKERGATLYIFDNPIAGADLQWTRRVCLRSTELETILEEIRKLVDQITDQARDQDA